jgi:hypothetical protein
MKSHLLGTMRAYLALSAPLAILVVSMSSAHGSITFQFEGELTHVDNPLSGKFSKGEKFTGTYTFSQTTPTSSEPPVSVFLDTISEMSFISEDYTASATNGNIIYDIEDEPYYEANAIGSSISASPIGDNTLQRLSLGWAPDNLFFPQETPPVDPQFPSDDGFFALGFNSSSEEFSSVYGVLTSVTEVTQTAVAHAPIPTSVWLFGSGLFGLIGMGRRKQFS